MMFGQPPMFMAPPMAPVGPTMMSPNMPPQVFYETGPQMMSPAQPGMMNMQPVAS